MVEIALDGGSSAGRMVMTTPLEQNAYDLEMELAWFARLLDTRFKLYFELEETASDIFAIPPPDLSESGSPYACFVRQHRLNLAERAALLLGLIPAIRPQLLDIFFTKNKTFDRKFTEFGGLVDSPEGAFIPTGETLAFILGSNNLADRFSVRLLFNSNHLGRLNNIFQTAANSDETIMKAPLRLAEELVELFTTGQASRPAFGTNFPARYIETQLSWDDLVLHPGTRKQIEEIETWLQHGHTLLHDWGMASRLRPGYRSLFSGPPGTGKTMTACLLGKTTGRDVYKVDLSLVISKYIGETEKNLAKVFDQAEHKNWILFFDEADALFGKRSETRDAHDRYANQEVSYLLQRIETFDGIAILASNRRDNMDEAFARRFESVIYFPIPRPEERLRLWRQGFPAQAQPDESLDLRKVALEYSLSGGAIMNVIRYATLQALKNGRDKVSGEDILRGIYQENAKDGRDK